ncbi:GMC family oxidoreductase [Aquisphaera insulae]|uniref:GMC family oxidoreductase n=1 Tax=Aquisphaera insulae TaxID=2712864 RepID=UPI0013EC618E|nr:GMC family oxidoreductase [Aquisphaera insulae]
MNDPAVTHDVVVIGAGVCGAIAAWRLARAGARVLMLEAGPADSDRTAMVGRFAAALPRQTGSPYADPDVERFAPTEDNHAGTSDGAYYDQRGTVRFQSTYVRRAGGSTWHFLGNMPRFLPADFELHDRYRVGRNWPIRYADLEEDYCTAEEWIGVAGDHDEWNSPELGHRSRPFPMSRIWPSYGDRVVAERLIGLRIDGKPVRLMSTPQARNARTYDGRPACAGNSICVPICPIQAKYDATVHVAKAIKAGAELRDRAVVTRIDRVDGSAEVGEVHYLRWDGRTVQPGSARGRLVVMAAHTIESAKILLLSGLATTSGEVGRNLMDHLQGSVFCYAPQPVYPFRGPPTTSGIDRFRDGTFRRRHAAFRLSLGNDGWGRNAPPDERLLDLVRDRKLHGRGLRDEVRNMFTRMIRFSFSTEMLPDSANRVELSSKRDVLEIPRPALTFALSPYNRAAFDAARKVCKRIFRHIGGTGIDFLPKGDVFSGAGHIIGTCRMGADPSDSVVDSYGRCHDHPNLFVLGSAVFPTSGTANPTLTAAALTVRSLRAIAADLHLTSV